MKTFVSFIFCLFFTLFTFCQTQKEILDYFNEVAYGSDMVNDPQTQKITKWDKDVKLYIDGYYTTQDLINVRNIISELNTLLTNIKITIVKSKSESNSIIYFGNFDFFAKKYLTGVEPYVDCNGYCVIYSFMDSPIIYNVKIFIKSSASTVDKKHAVTEEITQSLGLANDSWKYPESIFYEGYSTTDRLSKIDKEVIKMLYK